VVILDIWTGGESYSLFEAEGQLWLTVGGSTSGSRYFAHHLVDLATGTEAPGWPFSAGQNSQCAPAVGQIGQPGEVGTLDGVETTACWTTGAYTGSTSTVDCSDLGLPWSRSKVHWGTFGFDLEHTSRYCQVESFSGRLHQ